MGVVLGFSSSDFTAARSTRSLRLLPGDFVGPTLRARLLVSDRRRSLRVGSFDSSSPLLFTGVLGVLTERSSVGSALLLGVLGVLTERSSAGPATLLFTGVLGVFKERSSVRSVTELPAATLRLLLFRRIPSGFTFFLLDFGLDGAVDTDSIIFIKCSTDGLGEGGDLFGESDVTLLCDFCLNL